MANFEAFRWNISSSANPEIGRSDIVSVNMLFNIIQNDIEIFDGGGLVKDEGDHHHSRSHIGLFKIGT